MSQSIGDPERSKGRSGRKGRLRKSLSVALTGLGTRLVQFVCATLRIEVENEAQMLDTEGGKILCLWHSRTIPPMARYRKRGFSILTSLSRDGEIISTILNAVGYDVLRGSTGPSGARVLAACIKFLRGGGTLAVTPDGPRGPSGRLQPGVITMARKSGCPLFPLGSSARPPRVTMRSWDRFMFPFPFVRAIVIWGGPVYVPADANEEEMEAYRLQIETEMRRLQDEADRRLGMPTFKEIAARDSR